MTETAAWTICLKDTKKFKLAIEIIFISLFLGSDVSSKNLFNICLFLYLSIQCTFAQDINIKKYNLFDVKKINISNLILYDYGNYSPFIISIINQKNDKKCSSVGFEKNIIINIIDFGEAGKATAYCLPEIDQVYQVLIENVYDEKSEIGKAAIVKIRYLSRKNEKSMSLKITPWYIDVIK